MAGAAPRPEFRTYPANLIQAPGHVFSGSNDEARAHAGEVEATRSAGTPRADVDGSSRGTARDRRPRTPGNRRASWGSEPFVTTCPGLVG